MKRIIRIWKKIQRFVILRIRLKVYPVADLVRFGSKHADWVIPNTLLTPESICYLAGVGENIVFDVEVAQRYGSQVVLVDPTPRAKIHFDTFAENIRNGKMDFVLNQAHYMVHKDVTPQFVFIEKGLWSKKDTVKFYEPTIKEHVSHSIVNLQKTENYIEVEVDRLGAIMQANGHKQIDLLKLDIEGAEYTVIDSLLEDNLDIKAICIEFDEIHVPLDNGYIQRVNNAIQKLLKANYRIVNIDYKYNYTFLKVD